MTGRGGRVHGLGAHRRGPARVRCNLLDRRAHLLCARGDGVDAAGDLLGGCCSNPALLGGLVVRIGDDKFDDSVARELELLLAAFAARGSRELPRIQDYINNSEESSRGV